MKDIIMTHHISDVHECHNYRNFIKSLTDQLIDLIK